MWFTRGGRKPFTATIKDKRFLRRTDRESVWTESVTPPLGMKCYPSDQKGPSESGRGDWIRTSDPLRPRQEFLTRRDIA